MTRIPTYTIRTTERNESVIPDILLNGGSIPVGYGRLPIIENLFGSVEIETRGVAWDRHPSFLLSLNLETLPSMFLRTFEWTEEEYNEHTDEWTIVENYNEPLGAIVLLKAQCRSNLRCPMDKEYWQQWVKAGNLRSKETSILKDKIRKEFPKDYDIENTGAKIILPNKGGKRSQRDQYEYLVALANKGSFEYVFARSDGRPNTYRVECKDGQLYLIDPRAEVALSE